jgi:hypothetical protein
LPESFGLHVQPCPFGARTKRISPGGSVWIEFIVTWFFGFLQAQTQLEFTILMGSFVPERYCGSSGFPLGLFQANELTDHPVFW